MKIMQERPQYKITPEQGWSQMQSLLDKSLPVAHPSRRLIVFWWTSAIAVVAVITSLFLMKKDIPATDQHRTDTPVSGIAGNEINSTTTEHQSLALGSTIIKGYKTPATSTGSTINQQTSISTINKSTTSVSTSSINAAGEIHGSKHSADHTSMVFSDKQSNEHFSDPQGTDLVGNTDGQLKSETAFENSSSNQEDFGSGISMTDAKAPLHSAIDFLPLVDAFTYTFTDPHIELIPPGNTSFSFRHHVFSPTISIGAMAGSQHGLGINAAIGTDYAINSGLSLTAGIGFSSYHPGLLSSRNQKDIELINVPDPIIADTNYSETYIVGEKVNTSTDYNAINHFVQSVRQWEVSAGLKYTLTKRFFVEGGMVLGFGTTVRSEYPIVTFGSSVNTTADTNVKSTFNSYNIISSSMTSLYGGIGYKINRHLSVSAKWTQGLNHYLLNDQLLSVGPANKRLDYIRGLNLKIAFNL